MSVTENCNCMAWLLLTLTMTMLMSDMDALNRAHEDQTLLREHTNKERNILNERITEQMQFSLHREKRSLKGEESTAQIRNNKLIKEIKNERIEVTKIDTWSPWSQGNTHSKSSLHRVIREEFSPQKKVNSWKSIQKKHKSLRRVKRHPDEDKGGASRKWSEQRKIRFANFMKKSWQKKRKAAGLDDKISITGRRRRLRTGYGGGPWSEERKKRFSEYMKAYWKDQKVSGATGAHERHLRAMMNKYWNRLKELGRATERCAQLSRTLRKYWNKTHDQYKEKRKNTNLKLKQYWIKQRKNGNGSRHLAMLKEKMKKFWDKSDAGYEEKRAYLGTKIRQYWNMQTEEGNHSQALGESMVRYWNEKTETDGELRKKQMSKLLKLFWSEYPNIYMNKNMTDTMESRGYNKRVMKAFWEKMRETRRQLKKKTDNSNNNNR
ncbi:hypothetical protein WDU94_000524 [Cyamophila willieti]